MAINILAWNMQGSQSNSMGISSYTHLFQRVVPAVYKKCGSPLLVYICEAGNPGNLDPKTFKPGATAYYFDSTKQKLDFGLPRGFAAKGVYCPWQKVDPNQTKGGNNLRCSVMMLEVVKRDDKNNANFQFQFAFTASDDQNFGNIRPLVYGYADANQQRDFTIGGAHNVSNEAAAIVAINNLVSNFAPGKRGGAFVGDMNLSAPYSSKDPWPKTLALGKNLPMLSRQPTQKSGGQLDWGFQTMTPANKAACACVTALGMASVSSENSKFSGTVVSDHEMLFYQIN